MSFPGYEWAWKVVTVFADEFPPRGGRDRLLFRLGHHANKKLLAWPGNNRLAEATMLDERTIERQLKRLEKLGLIERVPHMRSDGRGRGADRIRLLPVQRPTRQTAPSEDTQQPDKRAAATRQNASDQPDKRGGRSSIREPTTGTDRGKGNGIPARLPVVDGHQLTEVEFSLASAALDAFNERNGSRLGLLGTTGKPTDALTRIICRVREHPELNDGDLVRIVNRNFDNPWWVEPKLGGVGPIFGPKAWARAMANDGVPRTSGRTTRRSADRVPNREEEEPW